MIRILRSLFISTFIFSILPFAFAQKEETGAISGSVKDEDGRAIPGVTIIASNMRLIGYNSSTYSGTNGSYRFPVLLPGEYEIKAELQGFRSIVRKGVRLFVGQTVIVDFVLQPHNFSEVLEIQAETPAFDATSPAMSKTIPREEIENLPGFIGSERLFTLTPGVGSDQVAYGSPNHGNIHTLDGTNITHQTGRPATTLNVHWIEEIQVTGLGAPAEYGGFTGVVANTVTRSGSNQFTGLVETFFQDDSFNSNNVVDEDTSPFERIFTDTNAQLGGPILRDKLWFFTGLQYLYTKESPFDGSPTGEEASLTTKNARIFTKLTYQLNRENTLQGFITRENPTETGLEAHRALPEATGIRAQPLWVWNLGWISFLKSETFLDVRIQGVALWEKETGRDPNLPCHVDVKNYDIISQNYCWYNNTERLRNYANAALSHHASDFLLGNHEFKFGVQYQRSHVDGEEHYNGSIYYYDHGTAPFERLIKENHHIEVINNSISTFAQDDWQITDQLNLSLGVRWDRIRIKLLTDPVEYGTDAIAPRVGIACAFNRNRTTVIKVHYGHYYDNEGSAYIDALHDSSITVIKETFNQETRKWELPDYSIGGGPSVHSIDDDLKQPYSRQFTSGIDHVFPAGVNFSAHYIYKEDSDLMEDVDTTSQFAPVPYVNPITGETITVYNWVINSGDGTRFITNPPGLFRRYHGVEIYGSKRLSEKFYLGGSIVFSRIKGNVDNDLEESSGRSRIFDSPNEQINSEGQLENDVSTEIKLHGYYYLPWGFNTSWYYRHYTAETWTPLVLVTGLNQGRFHIYGLPRGSNRLPARNTVDIRIEKMLPVSRGDLRFTLDVFNLFNTGYPLAVDAEYESKTFGEPVDFSPPREFRIGVRYTF